MAQALELALTSVRDNLTFAAVVAAFAALLWPRSRDYILDTAVERRV